MSAPSTAFSAPPWIALGAVVAVLLGSLSCTRPAESLYNLGPQAYYRTGFPLRDTSETLEHAFRSMKRIQSLAYYTTYVFPPETAPLETDLISPDVLSTAVDTLTWSQERAATAVIVSRSGRNVALVTVAHALTFPDTILDFYDTEAEEAGLLLARSPPRQVESVSLLTQQTNWVLGLPDLDPFEILATEETSDVALIGVEYRDGEDPGAVDPLRITTGDPRRLVWGSFVYVLGYPRGYPMVTRGVVSAPDHPTLESFVVDGLWNRGMSGGLILAVRGDGGGLEWVGMARAAAGSIETRLVPEEDALEDHDIRRPYVGPIYVEEFQRIDYGITLSVPMTWIRRFLDVHRGELRERGYEVPSL
jgi:hypothetical protein